MIKISHPLPSTSACSPAAVWYSMAMEARLFSAQREQNNRYWQHFLCFAFSLPHPPPHLSSLPRIQSRSVPVRSITLSFSLPLPTYRSSHLSHLPLSHLFLIIWHYLTLSFSMPLLRFFPLTLYLASQREREIGEGICTCWLWHAVYIPCR